MNSISLHRRARLALFSVIWLLLILALAFGAGLRLNPTPSLPKGIYRISPGTPGKGDLVSFCLEGEYAALARERGYLEAGSCPSGLRPLLKRLAGLPGCLIPSESESVNSEILIVQEKSHYRIGSRKLKNSAPSRIQK